ncbi:MAG: protein translocase subunit SecDF [Paludibacter sp.]|jgi:SecD/SecF fusion protein|nr:protein translocase subunit SecDF [Paludibacter sp.]
MQNKGIIRIFAGALTLVCLFYLSFSVVTSTYNKKAQNYSQGDLQKEYAYLDSIANTKVWLNYTLKECREKEINLGLDLKGGMNVTLEVSVPDIIRALSGYNTTPNFNQALATASENQKTNSQKQYLDLFVDAYKKLDPNVNLASIFSTYALKDKINLNYTNDQVIKVLETEINDAISNSFNVLRTRIDRFGVVQPNIQRDNNNTGRILIELPGVKEPERVRKLLQGSANLEFWETYNFDEIQNSLVAANSLIYQMNIADKDTTKTVAQNQNTATAEIADSATTSASLDSMKAAIAQTNTGVSDSTATNAQWLKENPLFALLHTEYANGCVIGAVQSNEMAKVDAYLQLKQVHDLLPPNLGFRWEVKPVDAAHSGGKEMYRLIAIKYTTRDQRAPLAGDVITDARADFGQQSAYAEVSMSMTSEGQKIWARLTKENINRSIAIVLDGYAYSYPNVLSEITGGSSQITGHFSVEEAKDLANTLKSGKMPAPARIVQEDVVGPSLGQEAINNGLLSFIIAFILVLAYMIFYYGKIPGIIADIALFVNVFFLMGILASFGAVLTLPGIAGIVLTLGMAVDGNVLIYERVREEIEAGKTQRTAIRDGFKNAISAIIDANVTSLLTGIILMIFGTGPILGFATTLVIGIVTSFITSVFLTRMMLEMYAARENAKQLAFTTRATASWFQNLKWDFIGKRKIGYIASLAVIVVCFASFATQGLSFGIDFSGGRNYIVRFDKPVDTEEIREILDETFKDDTDNSASVSVISIGADNQVRIATKYKIDDNSETADNEVVSKIFEVLKANTTNPDLLPADLDIDHFVTDYVMSSQKVGPTVADDILTAAVWAIFFSLIVISLYIFIRFNDFAFSVGTLASLAHDVIIILGIYSLFYKIMPFSMEMDQAFIAAILTYIGYSVNDTVVIFDRIRENIRLFPKRSSTSIMNESLNETMSRTFSTSASVLVVMLAIFIFGGETIRGFIFALLVGSILGVYSTLFIAVPVSHDILVRNQKRKAAKEAASLAKK